MSAGAWKNLGFLALVLAVFMGLRLYMGRTAPVPDAFANDVSLAEAIAQSHESGKPVFAVFTADWCGPCQSYKRGSLASEKVANALRTRAIPVYVNVDTDREDLETLEQVGYTIQGVPTTVVIRGHEVSDYVVGALDAGDVLSMIDRPVVAAGGE